MKIKMIKNSQNHFEKNKNKFGRISLLNFKSYYRIWELRNCDIGIRINTRTLEQRVQKQMQVTHLIDFPQMENCLFTNGPEITGYPYRK